MPIFNEQGRLADKWSKCPNILIDKLMGQVISASAGLIVLNIFRLTDGMNGRPSAAIPTTRFMNLLGVKKKETAYQFVKEAVNSGLITVKKVNGMINVYSINTECPHWDNEGVVPKKGTSTEKGDWGSTEKGDWGSTEKGDSYKESIKENKESSSSSRENDFSILIQECQEWQQPTLDKINEQLKNCRTDISSLDKNDYQVQVGKFKNWLAEQAANGRPVKTDNRRIDLLIEWIERNYLHQQQKAKTTTNSKIDWSSVGVKPNDADGDLPSAFNHSPSHSNPVIPAKIDYETMVLVNGLWREPFPNMSRNESYAHIEQQKMAGEMADETYDRLLSTIQTER